MSGAVEGVALAACPFCAGTETGLYRPTEAREGSGWHDWFVRCHQCHVESAEYETEAEAVTAWNTRTTPPARSYADAIEDAAKVAEAYTEVNFEAAGDSVLLDPVLRGKGFSAKNMAESERQQIAGLVHSSQAHAGKHLAAAIRLLSQGEKA